MTTLEEIICNRFQIEESTLYSNDRHRTRQECEALHFLWYIMHHVYNKTYGELARKYKKTRRNVIFETQKIYYGVQSQKYYFDNYVEIMNEIEIQEQKEKASH